MRRILTAGAAIALAAGLATAAQAHGMGGQGQGMMMGRGGMMGDGAMMGQGQGPMMGQGGMMGSGPMKGQGQGQGGMMGQMGPMMGMMGQRGMMHGGGMGRAWMGHHLPQDLTADSVRHILSMHIEAMGNDRLKVGDVTEQDDDTIVADIVTVDDSLVRRLEIDRHTGFAQPGGADGEDQ